MENKKVVVALGRNAFSESFPKQQERVKAAAKAIADLVEEKYEVIITHSNGPQVGMIQTAMTEYSRLDPDRTVDISVLTFRMLFVLNYFTEEFTNL